MHWNPLCFIANLLKLFPNIDDLILHLLLDDPINITLLQASAYHPDPLEMTLNTFTFNVLYTLHLNRL